MSSFQRSPAIPGVTIQSEDHLTAYVGRIVPNKLTVATMGPLTPGKMIGKIWQEQLRPVFTGYWVSVTDPTKDLEQMGLSARQHIVRMFWEQVIRSVARSQGISLETAAIEKAASVEMQRHAKNGWLPEGLVMKLERDPLDLGVVSTGNEEEFLAWMRAFSAPRLPS